MIPIITLLTISTLLYTYPTPYRWLWDWCQQLVLESDYLMANSSRQVLDLVR